MMDTIAAVKRGDAGIVVNNIYNPAVGMNLPEAFCFPDAGICPEQRTVPREKVRWKAGKNLATVR